MCKCTDIENKTGQEILGTDNGHEWIVIEWQWTYTNSYDSSGSNMPGTVKVNLPYPFSKKATRIMCKYCKKIEYIQI